MKKLIISLVTLGLMATGVQAQNKASLDQLLQEVRQAATQSSRENQQRINEFKQQRNQQSQLLSQARAKLQALEARTEELKTDRNS